MVISFVKKYNKLLSVSCRVGDMSCHLLGKGWPLGSRLWCLLWVCHFPISILGQVWYLIVSIPDLCTLTYFVFVVHLSCRWIFFVCQFLSASWLSVSCLSVELEYDGRLRAFHCTMVMSLCSGSLLLKVSPWKCLIQLLSGTEFISFPFSCYCWIYSA